MKKKIISIIIGLLIIGGIVWFFVAKQNSVLVKKADNLNTDQTLITQATYLCKNNKTINASFYEGKLIPVKEGEMPIPTGSVKLVLSDGRNLDLSQTISADGVRYANSDESFIFWSKGNGALVLENNEEKDYVGCIVLAKDLGDLPNVYLDPVAGFSIRYPIDYSIDTSYKYQGLGPNKEIHGVKFIIPKSFASGTNLSSYDTGVSVEIISEVKDCRANLFLNSNAKEQTIQDNNGREYSFASSTEGAAGNFYEEEVWAFSNANSCIAVRYLIHSMNINNYPENTVLEFNRQFLIEQFDEIKNSLITL